MKKELNNLLLNHVINNAINLSKGQVPHLYDDINHKSLNFENGYVIYSKGKIAIDLSIYKEIKLLIIPEGAVGFEEEIKNSDIVLTQDVNQKYLFFKNIIDFRVGECTQEQYEIYLNHFGIDVIEYTKSLENNFSVEATGKVLLIKSLENSNEETIAFQEIRNNTILIDELLAKLKIDDFNENIEHDIIELAMCLISNKGTYVPEEER